MGEFISKGALVKAHPKRTRSARKLPVFIVTDPIVFEAAIAGRRKRYTLGVGSEIDGVSTNWWFRFVIGLLAPTRTRLAAAVHDMLCQMRDLEKPEADLVFLCAMEALSVPRWLRLRMYHSVAHSSQRNNWPQPRLTPVLNDAGLPGSFVECPVEVVE